MLQDHIMKLKIDWVSFLYSTGQIMSKLFCNLLLYYLKRISGEVNRNPYCDHQKEKTKTKKKKEKTYNEEENTSSQV